MTTNQPTTVFGAGAYLQRAGNGATSLLVAVRLVVGYWFLHAGWTKFAFVAGEPFDASGYLANAESPLAWLFEIVAGTPWLLEFTNVMIPLGEFLIGLGILLGAMTRLAAFFGGFLMVLFYLGNADWVRVRQRRSDGAAPVCHRRRPRHRSRPRCRRRPRTHRGRPTATVAPLPPRITRPTTIRFVSTLPRQQPYSERQRLAFQIFSHDRSRIRAAR